MCIIDKVEDICIIVINLFKEDVFEIVLLKDLRLMNYFNFKIVLGKVKFVMLLVGFMNFILELYGFVVLKLEIKF